MFQWLGEAPLRRSMEGRLLLVQLMCKEEQTFFTPCVGLRVAGTPSEYTVKIIYTVLLIYDF